MRSVEVIPFRSEWSNHFGEAADVLSNLLGDDLLSIHHIGSTAIPGMPAKPIIDMMPVLARIEVVDEAQSELEDLGYEVRGEYGIPGRRYLVRAVSGMPKLHVHSFQSEHPAIARHLAFRDYLMAHPADAHRYAELKMKLARSHKQDRSEYQNGKASLISEIERKAIVWMNA